MPPNVSELIPSWLLLTRGWKTGKRKPIEYNTIQKALKCPNSPHYRKSKQKILSISWKGRNNKIKQSETVGGRRSQTGRMNTNEQDTCITECKIRNTT